MSDLRQEVATIQERINGILTDDEKIIGKRKHLQRGDKIPERWNHFDLDQQRKVTTLGAEYSGILANVVDDISTTPKDLKNYKDEKFLAKVKELVPLLFEVTKRVTVHLNLITEYDPALVKYAFNVFVNNHPATIFLDLKTPSLKRLSSVPNGIPDPKFPNPKFAYTKDRQGELFVWMHKQMLARVAVGLDPVVQLKDYKNPIREGYLPNDYLLNYNEKSDLKDLQDKYDYRLPNSSFAPDAIKKIDGWVAAINKSIDDGVFYNAPDRLGRTIDPDRVNPDIFEDDEWKAKYGRFHGTGHIIIADIAGNKPLLEALQKNIPNLGNALPMGLIGNVSIAPKDPAFYRWHRFVDETFNRAFESMSPRIFSDAPNVVIKSCDLRFVFKDELVKVCPTGEKDRWQQFAETNYAQIPYTDVLQTKMVPRNLRTPDGSIQIEHLFPREFYYIFKITNKTTREGYNPSTKKLEP
ncbi:1123_t:CDS:2, partial [Gigaspora margarita]